MQEKRFEEFTVDQIFERFGGRKRFGDYVEFLLEENSRINLVSRETSREDLYRLVADCLVPVFVVGARELFLGREELHILDIGSGGGLPGLPLALGLENVELTLIERTGKKALFLLRALEALGIGGRVLNCNFREFANNPAILTTTGALPADGENSFDIVTIRWVKAERALIRAAVDLLSGKNESNGLLYYSPADELDFTDEDMIERSSFCYRLAGDTQENRTLTVFKRQ